MLIAVQHFIVHHVLFLKLSGWVHFLHFVGSLKSFMIKKNRTSAVFQVFLDLQCFLQQRLAILVGRRVQPPTHPRSWLCGLELGS